MFATLLVFAAFGTFATFLVFTIPFIVYLSDYQPRLLYTRKTLQDRPDLIQSELAGLAFDSLQQVFRKSDVEIMFASPPLELASSTTVWLVVDPAAGGPQSDYAVVTIARIKGCVVVRMLVFPCLYSYGAMRFTPADSTRAPPARSRAASGARRRRRP